MRNVALAAGLVALALSPVSAQEAVAPAETAAPVEFTNADFLDCAVWAAVALGQNPEGEASRGLGFALSWFIGRYEGSVGRDIDEDMMKRASVLTGPDIATIEPKCTNKMGTMGRRLMTLGARMQSAGAQ